MDRILRNWPRLNRQQRVDAAKVIHTKLTGNADVTTPAPTLTALNTLITAAQQKIDDVAAMEASLAELRGQRDAALDALVAALQQEASTVEGATAGEATKMIGAGFLVAGQSAPVGALLAPQDFRATAGDNDGELDFQWDAVDGAGSHEVQTSATPNDPASWVTRPNPTPTRSSATISGLPSGTRIFGRARALGAAGPGPWSDSAGKMVP